MSFDSERNIGLIVIKSHVDDFSEESLQYCISWIHEGESRK